MSGLLCILGAAAIGAASLVLARAYAGFVRRRVREYESLLAFLTLMRREMSCSLLTPRELAERSGNAILEEIGFTSALRRGEHIGRAFSLARGGLRISEEDSSVLLAFFERFGKGSLDTELRSLEETIAVFSERAAIEGEDAPREIRLSATLLTLAALALVILLL